MAGDKGKNLFQEPIVMLVACAVVGVLATRDVFSSMFNFPWVFGLVCLFFGLLSLRRHPRVALGKRLALVLLGPALATAGFFVHLHEAEKSRVAVQAKLSAEITGADAPRLTDMTPFNVEPAVLEQAASYASPATIVTFWARWCSPCWKELPELDELYRRHSKDGLAVVGLTRYDEPDEAARRKQFERDRELIRDRGISLPMAVTTDDGVYQGFLVNNIPRTALVDGDGKIVAYGVGLEGGREVMRRAAALIGEG